MKNIWKKIIALVCVMSLCIGSIHMTTKAVDSYTGKLTIKGSLTSSSDPTNFYIKGTDSYTIGEEWSDSTMMPAENDTESGIFVDGVRLENYYSAGQNPTSVRLRKIDDDGEHYYIEKIPNVSTGSVVTIKGTFYVYGGWLQTDVFNSTPIVIEESKFQWNGSQWIDCYGGKLAIKDSLATSSDSTNFYIKGTDSYTIGEEWSDSTMMPANDDTASGIFVDGVRLENYYSAGQNPTSVRLRKINDDGEHYYIEKIPNVSTGSVVTIKGTFYVYGGWLQTDVFDSTPIVIEESKFQWNGTQWVDYEETVVPDTPVGFTGKLTITGSAATTNVPTCFYIKGTDDYITGDDWPDSTMMPAENDTESGIFVDGVRINDYYSAGKNPSAVRLRKYDDANNYYYIEKLSNIETGSIVTIKGTFYTYGGWLQTDVFDPTPVTFEESSFKWNGTTWGDYEKPVVPETPEGFTGKLTIAGSAATSDNATWFYLEGTDEYKTGSDDWPELTMMPADGDTESGIFVDGVRINDYFSAGNNPNSVRLRKWSDSGNDYYIERIPNVSTNSVVTIKGTFYVFGNWMETDEFDTTPIIFEESKFQWTGSTWIDYVEEEPETPREYSEGVITGFQVSTPPTYEGSRWSLYLNTSVELLGSTWDDGGKYPVVVTIDNDLEFVATVKKAGRQTLYFDIPTSALSENQEAQITIKAGTYDKSAENYGFVLKEDYTFYTSKYGWSVSDIVLEKNVKKAGWMLSSTANTATGFYVDVIGNDDVPVTGWDKKYSLQNETVMTSELWLKPIGGAWDEDGSLVDADVKFQKLGANSSYVNVSALGVSTNKATYVIGGVYYDTENNTLVDYESLKVVWNGTSWTQIANSLVDTEVDADVNSDGVLDSRDMARLIRHQDNGLVSINEVREDINYDGSKDSYDVTSIRKILSGGLLYLGEGEQAAIPYGVPTIMKHMQVKHTFSLQGTLNVTAGNKNDISDEIQLKSVTSTNTALTIHSLKNRDGFTAYEVKNGDSATDVTLEMKHATGAIIYKNDEVLEAKLQDGTYSCSMGSGESIWVIPVRELRADDFVDFVVEVEEGRSPVVLQISDTQIIDSSQDANNVFGQVQINYNSPDRTNEHCYDYLDELIDATNPDLIILTGDIVYGRFDNDGSRLLELVSFMEGKGIPWAPVFGNHDNESAMGVDWQCEQFENAEHCLFKQRTLTGNGNYTVGIKQGDDITRVFFMLDSNGCNTPSDKTLENDHMALSAGFGNDQIAWYTGIANNIKSVSPETKLSFAFHIQFAMFEEAYKSYGDTNPINIDTHEDKKDGDFGYLGYNVKGDWDKEHIVYQGLKKLGVDSLFVGHEHCNSASVVYDGIRFQYGQKSSAYDSLNHLDMSNGQVIWRECEESLQSLIGGTVLPLDRDGSIKDPYIYMCGFEDGIVDWNAW